MSLSKHEQAELQRLLAKAKGRAVRPCDSPFEDEYDGFCVYDPSTGLFHNPETGETRDVWTEESVFGAMSDASKRRDATDGSDDDHQCKRVMKPTAKSSAMPLQDPRPTSLSQGYTAPPMMVPYPGGSNTHGVVMSNLPELPPGVENVTMWSRTVISFGRFQGRDMTYFDLVTSQQLCVWPAARFVQVHGSLFPWRAGRRCRGRHSRYQSASSVEGLGSFSVHASVIVRVVYRFQSLECQLG